MRPLGTRFRLGEGITDEQHAFLEAHGYLHFEGVATEDEVSAICAARDRVEREWLADNRQDVNGIPLFFGRGENGETCVQRMPFSSVFSETIHSFIRDERFEPVRLWVGDDARVGDEEKDGVVFNKFVNVKGSVYGRLGWHTDGLRDLFYLRMPQQMPLRTRRARLHLGIIGLLLGDSLLNGLIMIHGLALYHQTGQVAIPRFLRLRLVASLRQSRARFWRK